MKAIHCVYDEKFIDGAISLFETDNRIQNDYVLFVHKKNLNKPFKFIKSSKVKKVILSDFVDKVNGYDIVYLHSLYSIDLQDLLKIKNKIKVVWFSWGWDLYNKYVIPLDLYQPLTKKYIDKSYRKVNIKRLYFDFLRSIKFKKIRNVIYRIDYYSGVFPYEYDLLKQFWPNVKVKPLDFYYGSTDFYIPEKNNPIVKNNFDNIIIGNSNSPENNHLDALKFLMQSNLQVSGKVIIPLSYGKDKNYKKIIIDEARSIWGAKLQVLDKYLPLYEYLDIVSNCKVAVFFHERQQASDNVLMQILYGAKVYMSENSLMFQYLKNIGFRIFSLQQDLSGINIPLCYDDIIYNRRLLCKLYSSSELIRRVKDIVSELLK